MKALLRSALIVTMLAAPLVAQGPAPGTANGKFTAAGKVAEMKYAYALIKPDTFDEEKDTVFLFLTDQPVSEDVLRGEWGLSELARDGKVNAVEMRLDETRAPRSGQLYHSGLDGSVSVSGILKMRLDYYDGKKLVGRVYSGKEESFGSEWEVDAEFAVVIVPKPPEPAAAEAPLDSPPAKAALAFVKAARAKDKAALKGLVAPEMYAQLEGPQGAEFLNTLPSMFPASMKLSKVIMKGEDRAEVRFEEKSDSGSATTRFKLELVDGKWRITNK